jgi:hypothetical protein
MYSMIPPTRKVSKPMMDRFVGNVLSVLGYIKSKKAEQPLVYHYTNGSGLLGIAESKSLWATHIGFMNDTEEYREAVRMLVQLGLTRIAESKLHPAVEFALFTLRDEMFVTTSEDDTFNIKADSIPPWFVTCFSECKDDLAQWRGYSTGGAKFSLGMELNHLGALVYHLGQPSNDGIRYQIHLVPAVYSKDEKERFLNMILDFIIDQYPRDEAEISPDNDTQFAMDWLGNYLSLASVVAPVAKNTAFAQEREWRLIVMPVNASEIKYRSRGALLTPYIEIDLRCLTYKSGDKEWSHPVRECWVGPSPHMDSNRFSVRNMLAANKFFGVDLHLSTVPFRDL